MGYIEVFDNIEFNSKMKWDNQVTIATKETIAKENL
jgi:hypothetical protein